MLLPMHKWHQRYQQQARWTGELRAHVFSRVNIGESDRILEVGCGTGAILATVPNSSHRFGLDVDIDSAVFSQENLPASHIVCGDGHLLPYQDNAFAVTLCHFLLLWAKNPRKVIQEMIRVTRPNGYILLLAEPDYGGRIDHPEVLEPLGKLQAASLQNQGADPYMGRQVIGLARQLGIDVLEAGVISNRWQEQPQRGELELEWTILEMDLENLSVNRELSQLTKKEFNWLRREEEKAWQKGSRVLFIPTFYVWGRRSP